VRLKIESFKPEESEEHKKQELNLFIENMDLILENSNKILSCGEYFHCKLSFAYIGTIYFGGGYIPLGILIIGREEGILRDKCLYCNNETLWIAGFSGGFSFGSKWGVCEECKKFVVTNCKPSDYIEIWRKIVPIIHSYPSWQIVEVEKEVAHFSWSKGVVYKKKKVKEKINFYKSVKLQELVRELREGKKRKCKELIHSFKDTPTLKELLLKRKAW